MGKEGAEGCVDQASSRARACVSCAGVGHACIAFPDEVRGSVQQAVQDFLRNNPGDRARAGTRMNSALHGKKPGPSPRKSLQTPRKSTIPPPTPKKRPRGEGGEDDTTDGSPRPRSAPRRDGSSVSNRGGILPSPSGENDGVLVKRPKVRLVIARLPTRPILWLDASTITISVALRLVPSARIWYDTMTGKTNDLGFDANKYDPGQWIHRDRLLVVTTHVDDFQTYDPLTDGALICGV
ncbi:hypothetical protein PHISP_04255 [Aspergillus sp. HF37]|nr:hypothetical protein PHISP_04255 [Aspergillus sp. HF37]